MVMQTSSSPAYMPLIWVAIAGLLVSVCDIKLEGHCSLAIASAMLLLILWTYSLLGRTWRGIAPRRAKSVQV